MSGYKAQRQDALAYQGSLTSHIHHMTQFFDGTPVFAPARTLAGAAVPFSAPPMTCSTLCRVGRLAVHFPTAAAQESSALVAELLTGDMLTHSNTSVLLVDHEHRETGNEAHGGTDLPPAASAVRAPSERPALAGGW
jgi:hypothetical protein